jgi:hypothetical protein
MADATGVRRQHAVIIHLKLSDLEFGSFEERETAFRLEDRLESAVEDSGLGEYDGHEFGKGWCQFYIYGGDANVIADTVLPVVRTFALRVGSFVVKRFGPPGAREDQVPL